MDSPLFKFVGFNRDYWSDPLTKGTLYFASLPELRKTNDASELTHFWNSGSYFLDTLKNYMEPTYDGLFQNSRTLCMATALTEKCWNSFCTDSEGVCFEFSHVKKGDVMRRPVNYSKTKEHNVSDFLIAASEGDQILRLINVPRNNIGPNEAKEFLGWVSSGVPNVALRNHIIEELVFKKLESFNHENEFRFVHLDQPVTGQKLKTVLSNGTVAFTELGLCLERIHTSNVEKVKIVCDALGITVPIQKPSFLSTDF